MRHNTIGHTLVASQSWLDAIARSHTKAVANPGEISPAGAMLCRKSAVGDIIEGGVLSAKPSLPKQRGKQRRTDAWIPALPGCGCKRRTYCSLVSCIVCCIVCCRLPLPREISPAEAGKCKVVASPVPSQWGLLNVPAAPAAPCLHPRGLASQAR
jgi:hypothetical protein